MAKRRTRKKGKPRGTKGRNPTGLQPGEKLSEYPRTTVRLPPNVRELLERTAVREQRQQWRVLVDAISGYAKGNNVESKHVKWNDTTKVRGLEIVGQFEQFIREGGAPSPELLAGVEELKDIIDAKARAEGINRSKTRVDSSRQPRRKVRG